MATFDITADTFLSSIEEHEILLVDFWASWCGPCARFAPIYEAASERHAEIAFGSVNTESEQHLSRQLGISSIPTLMAFRQGVRVFAESGALPAPALDRLIEQVQGLDMTAVHEALAQQGEG